MLIEFALITPLLVLLLFGIVEFGLAMYRTQGLHAASRDAARAGSYPVTTQVQIRERALASLESTRLENEVVIEVEPDVLIPCADAAQVIVTITTVDPVTIPFWDDIDITLNSRSEFLCEN